MAARWSEEMRARRPRALPWARTGLRRLHRAGIRLGLVTASTRAVVEPSIARLNLEGLFDVAVYADDVADGKPHPEGLLRALGELGIAAGASVYVGDTTVDLEMARAVGTPFVAVGTTTSPAAFRAAGVERLWDGVGAWVDDVLGPRR
jgi:HAD superfamily hydrolase (TIGR01509 family)